MATGTLTGQTIANTYKSLLKITGTTAGGETLHSTTQKVIEDGDGNAFPLSVAADAVMITSTNRLEFGDDGTYIHQSADGTLDLVADTILELNGGAGSIKIDANSRISLSNNDSGASNTIFGKSAGDSDGAGDFNVYIGELSGGTGTQTDASDANVGIGYNALTDITTGYSNVGVGYTALQNVTTGHNNVSIGSEALNACTVGQYNIAIGRQSLYTDDEGNSTTAVGHNAGAFQNLSGTNTESKNTLLGKSAGYYNVTGTGNTMLGYHSGQGDSNQSNSNNTAVGSQALGAITTGGNNTVVGANAADDMTIGSINVAIGPNALGSETVGDRSIAIGSASLFTQEGASNNLAVYNVGVGHATGYYNETGQYNTMVGGLAGFGTNASASDNTGIGYKALYQIGTGANNTVVGSNAGVAITTGSQCTAVGHQALDANQTGSYLTAIGNNALTACTASENTGVGWDAGGSIVGGANNCMIGGNAGDTLTTGNQNTCLGDSSDVSATGSVGQIAIGYNVTCAGDDTITVGRGTNIASLGLDGSDTSWAASSDERYKENITDATAGLDVINDLRPVNYNWKKAKDIQKDLPMYKDSDEPVLGYKYGEVLHGFIAQEVKKVTDKHDSLKDGFKMWGVREDGVQSVADGNLIPILVKAVQELSAKVTELESKLK